MVASFDMTIIGRFMSDIWEVLMSSDKRERVSRFKDSLLKRVTVRLSYRHLRRANNLGKGNASDGIRYALEKIKDEDES